MYQSVIVLCLAMKKKKEKNFKNLTKQVTGKE